MTRDYICNGCRLNLIKTSSGTHIPWIQLQHLLDWHPVSREQ